MKNEAAILSGIEISYTLVERSALITAPNFRGRAVRELIAPLDSTSLPDALLHIERFRPVETRRSAHP